MTREQAKELLPVIQAFVEGKTVQARRKHPCAKWEVFNESNAYFENDYVEYRIKPEPREFWIIRHKNDPEDHGTVYWQKPVPDSPCVRDKYDVIHVREVLE